MKQQEFFFSRYHVNILLNIKNREHNQKDIKTNNTKVARYT